MELFQTVLANILAKEELKIIISHMDDLDKCKSLLEYLILRLAEPYMSQVELLLTVPGVADPMTAIRIIAEIGVDMTQFESSKHLCSWAGLTPQNNESAGKKKPLILVRQVSALSRFLFSVPSPRAIRVPSCTRKS